MHKPTSKPDFRQLDLFSYRPVQSDTLIVDDESLFGHLLAYQETDEFREELATQLATEAKTYRKYTAVSVVTYRKRHPNLIKRRQALAKSKPKIEPVLRARQDNRCFYCKQDLNDKTEIDHRNPMIKGGSDDIDNLVLVCGWCNAHKYTQSERKWRNRMRTLLKVRAGKIT